MNKKKNKAHQNLLKQPKLYKIMNIITAYTNYWDLGGDIVVWHELPWPIANRTEWARTIFSSISQNLKKAVRVVTIEVTLS